MVAFVVITKDTEMLTTTSDSNFFRKKLNKKTYTRCKKDQKNK